MKYKILTGESEIELEKRVELWIKDGYKPQGGVSVTITNTTMYPMIRLYQAMVKE